MVAVQTEDVASRWRDGITNVNEHGGCRRTLDVEMERHVGIVSIYLNVR